MAVSKLEKEFGWEKPYEPELMCASAIAACFFSLFSNCLLCAFFVHHRVSNRIININLIQFKK